MPPGEIYGLLGLNGAGKTTMIRMLLGMVRPSAGGVELFGAWVHPGRLPIWGRVGYLVETPAAYPELTVRENLLIAYRLRRLARPAAVSEVIERLALGSYADRRALGFLSEATGIGGLFVFGLVFIWVFGREFADRTVKDLLALPVPRAAIVAAKFTVATAWCLLLAAWTGLLGIGVVTALRLPGADAGTVGHGLFRLLLTAIMTITLVAPFALLASVARGYLAPVGAILLATFLGQIVATLGYGAYFPWAVPALYAGIAGVHTRPGPIGYLLVALVGLAAVLGTGSWWRRADQTR